MAKRTRPKIGRCIPNGIPPCGRLVRLLSLKPIEFRRTRCPFTFWYLLINKLAVYIDQYEWWWFLLPPRLAELREGSQVSLEIQSDKSLKGTDQDQTTLVSGIGIQVLSLFVFVWPRNSLVWLLITPTYMIYNRKSRRLMLLLAPRSLRRHHRGVLFVNLIILSVIKQ